MDLAPKAGSISSMSSFSWMASSTSPWAAITFSA
eukprot:CAMPEP_0170488384 /NCGR_PEP_ID=MMETSP0208-20121228/6951_1 /TAXON_ID=197538 /ORGANISM="Strombidium inclinatum, Strain S3" /LENGTH=33 /DNA_ID= /DNA_START= /DNA_END= /DNA_ORIENTATION=